MTAQGHSVKGLVVAAVASAVLLSTAPARGQAGGANGWLIPPVDGPISAFFQAPETDYGPGHRGIDYAVTEGAGVRAAGAGIVTFAGSVAGVLAVTVDHGSGLVSTYSVLADVRVQRGQEVDQGTWLGSSGSSHRGEAPGLHFGVKLDGRYVDPLDYLGPLDLSGAIHLVPVVENPDELGGAGIAECLDPAALRPRAPAPNDNIAVVIAGIRSSTRRGEGPEIFDYGGRLLGYPARRTYHYSYKGTGGRRLHLDYDAVDTYGDLRRSGERLEALLAKIAARHPSRDVDIVAHSQGGIVARSYLEQLAGPWEPGLPRVEHLVTFSTPHGGAPLAGAVGDIRDDTLTGGLALDGLGWLSRRGAPIPDPGAQSISQLDPASDFMAGLASEDIVYGTRALALAMPNDVLVPADRALFANELSRVVSPEGLNGHRAIMRSAIARGIAHSFLSGAPESCRQFWDTWGPRLGAAVGWAEGKLGWAYGQAEDKIGGRLIKKASKAVATRWRRKGASGGEADPASGP